MLLEALYIISWSSMNWNWGFSPETLNSGHNHLFFGPYDVEIWQLTL